MEKCIFHIDVNSAFLSWEATYRIKHLGAPEDLRESPSAVTGDMAARHGIVLAKSLPAKRFGVRTGEAVWQAKRKCPGLVCVPPNYGLYQTSSEALLALLREYSPVVEQYSIDEAFIDMTGTEALWGSPEYAAHRLRQRIKEELGFTVNIGVSENKLLAKMASDFEKPDRVHTLYRTEIKEKMWGLPVSDLFFVGRHTTRALADLSINTIGELANTPREVLVRRFKKHGETIHAFANGIDVSDVIAAPAANKSYGNSTTTAFDVTDLHTAETVLLSLCETVSARLRADRTFARVVSVGIKDFEFSYSSRQTTLISPVNTTLGLHEAACRLLRQLWSGKPLRLLAVYTGRLDDGSCVQTSLLDFDTADKTRKIDGTLDAIRDKYGIDAVKRAVFMNSGIDHMSGGISREKRTTEYDKEGIRRGEL